MSQGKHAEIQKRKLPTIIHRPRTPKIIRILNLPSISKNPPKEHKRRNLITVITAFLSVSSLSFASAVYAVPLEPIDTTPPVPRIYQKFATPYTNQKQEIPFERPRVVYVLPSDISTYKNVAPDFVNDETKLVQFPFRIGVPITSPFGTRAAVCEGEGCEATTNHTGTDFAPGEGADVQAIADGIVTEVVNFDGNTLNKNSASPDPNNPQKLSFDNAAGTYVKIQHMIDGETVTSWYAHLQSGSVQVTVGEKVRVGYIVGKVGNTGLSAGAHLHLEINVNGQTIDPIPYLTAKNASSAQYLDQ